MIENAPTCAFVTLTIRHDRTLRLADEKRIVNEASRRARQGRGWQEIKASGGILGVVVGVEVLHSQRSGWHLHQHILIPSSASKKALRAAARAFVNRYIAEIEKLGASARLVGQDVKIVRDGEAADYAGKGSAAWEVTGGEKSARAKASRTPWELAVLAATGDHDARNLFLEYAEVMPGTRSCVVSASLAKALGIAAAADEDVPGDQQFDEVDAVVGSLPAPIWSRIWCRGKAAQVLSAVEKDQPWPEIEKLAQTLGAAAPPPPPPEEFADYDRIINTARARGCGKSGAAAARELNRAVDEARELAKRRGRKFFVDWAKLHRAYVETCAAAALN